MDPNEQAALWGELQSRLPGLKCNPGICNKHIPDLALLLRAAREAGWHYDLGAIVNIAATFWQGAAIGSAIDADPLTAAMLAMQRALDAEADAPAQKRPAPDYRNARGAIPYDPTARRPEQII